MRKELDETLRLIANRIENTGNPSVFIPMRDMPWFNERNGQLNQLYESGMIMKPRFYDNGVELQVTSGGKDYMKSLNPNSTNQKQSVFISYNWGSEDIADKIQCQLTPYAEVKRDKTNIRPWGDIVDFMNSIRDQDYAVLIISDAYLRSDACLYEVLQLMKNECWDQRVMYVVTEDTHIYKPIEQVDYIDYWKKKFLELEEALKTQDAAATSELAEELKKYKLIYFSIGEFMAKVKRTSNPSVDDSIEAIINIIKKDVPAESLTREVTDENEVKIATDSQSKSISEEKHFKIAGNMHDDAIKLRAGWNFHNDIALRLEMRARHVYGDVERPFTKIYDADAIEYGKFAEVLIVLIRAETNREESDIIDEFIQDCIPYIGKGGHEIDPIQAQRLLNRFFELTK